jgi:DNA polymerase-4
VTGPTRTILHVDMDAFYASVEQRNRPELRGKPVLVGGSGPRGVVMAASYESRVFGCHSAQPMAVALRLCPDAIVVRGEFGNYREASDQVFEILHAITPLVQPLSIDEAFLDVTGSAALFGDGPTIARTIKDRIREVTQLTASVGVAPNKFLAKLASDLDKPDGLTVLTEADIAGRVAGLPIERMWGVGPAAAERLHRRGIRTFGDMQQLPQEVAQRWFGSAGDHYWRLARGLDKRKVHPDHAAKSIGNERTFPIDVADRAQVRDVLRGQADHVAQRLRRHRLRGRTVAVKIRYGDFETITRAATLDRATDRTDRISGAAVELFDAWATRDFRPVRLIGASVRNLESERGRQLELFEDPAETRARRIDRVTDTIAERFGADHISRGVRREQRS